MGARGALARSTPLRAGRLTRVAVCPVPAPRPAQRQVLITLGVMAVALPLCIWDLSRHHHEVAYISARPSACARPRSHPDPLTP